MGSTARVVIGVLLLVNCSAFVPSDGRRSSLLRLSAAGWVEVPIEGDRIARIRKQDVAELEDLRERIGSTERAKRTHVVVLPSPEQGRKQFDATIGALKILGIFGMVSNIPRRAWQEQQELIKSTETVYPACSWSSILDSDMLSQALSPLFDEFYKDEIRNMIKSCCFTREDSSTADLPAVDHLVLVGCKDGAWVLHAFLHELYRHGITPREHLTVVALGASTNTLLAKAVTAVYPGCLEKTLGSNGRVSYLSLYGSALDRGTSSVGGDYPDASREEYATGTEVTEAMTCLSTRGNAEECVISSSGWDKSTEQWHAEPRTVAKWISRCIWE